jgi:hypothetical protein
VIQSYCMATRSEAEEHLRIIRSLMERATIYRAISAEAAAFGGSLAIVGSFVQGNWINGVVPWAHPPNVPHPVPSVAMFIGTWAMVLVAATFANLWALRRAALVRQEPFVSSGMKLALTSLLPSFFIAGVLTLELFFASCAYLAAPLWVACYGLALLSTRHFAPRSLIYLGWAFLVFAAAVFPLSWATHWLYGPDAGVIIDTISGLDRGYQSHRYSGDAVWAGYCTAQMTMAISFGILHLIYAACIWPRKSSETTAAAAA